MIPGTFEQIEDENRRLKLEVTQLRQELLERDALVKVLEAQIKVLIKQDTSPDDDTFSLPSTVASSFSPSFVGALPTAAPAPAAVSTTTTAAATTSTSSTQPTMGGGGGGGLPPRSPAPRTWAPQNRGRILSRVRSDEDDESTRPVTMPGGHRRPSLQDPPRRIMEVEESNVFTVANTVLAVNGSALMPQFPHQAVIESDDQDEENEESTIGDLDDATIEEMAAKKSLTKARGTIKCLPRELSIRNAEDDDVTKYSMDDTNMPDYYLQSSEMRDANSARGLYTGSVSRKHQVPNGKGIMNYHLQGRSYEGDWILGHWHGQGKLLYPNRDVFEGRFENDLRIGHGVLYYNDGRVFSGHFQDDDPVTGTLTFPDGSQYCGELYNQARHGFGTYYFNDGSTYEGMSCMNVFEGQGRMTWPDGGWYEGEWLAGEISGRGKEVRADGTVRHDGQWSHGMPIRRN